MNELSAESVMLTSLCMKDLPSRLRERAWVGVGEPAAADVVCKGRVRTRNPLSCKEVDLHLSVCYDRTGETVVDNCHLRDY